jgi:molecular chaperone GrpE
MRKKTKKKPADEVVDEPLEEGAEAPAAPAETLDPLAQAEKERDEHFANLLRAHADNQNLRRRSQENIDLAVRATEATMLGEMLQALDWLDMALMMPVETPEAQNLKVGVQMTRDNLWGSLQRFKIAPIDTDIPFDPTLHQAVAATETEDSEPGTILTVVRPGWMRGDDVLRHAHVKVAAAPAPETPEASEEDSVQEPSDGADEPSEGSSNG